MTSRMSSGSSRAEIAVDPSRSRNITVSCRRSASGCGGGASTLLGDGTQDPAAVAEHDTDLLQIAIAELAQHIEVDALAGEHARVAPQIELRQLVRNISRHAPSAATPDGRP